MKRLIIALVAAVAVSTGFARVTIQEGFESETPDFPGISSGDASVVSYETADTSHALYPFANGGSKYLELDTEGTVSCVNSSGASYFDMYMQFNPSTTAPELDEDTKIAVYMNTAGNLVVIDATDTNVTQTALTAGNWYRLTIAAKTAGFDVLLDGTLVGTYTPITGDATITSVGFKGSGALDNFVARTTDPFLQNPAATIGGEGYASYTDALKEALKYKSASETLTISANDTTMDGTASNPYQIASANDLLALQDAVLANEAVRSLNYVQTANIDMTGVTGFYGIGWFDSSTSFASVPAGVASDGKTSIPFAGTYDGQGYTISNVTIVKHSYAGVFNNVSGTVKNLTVQDIGLSGTCTEWGCAIVGNAGNGSLLENLTAVTSSGFNWGNSANHNVAGIVVRPIGTATIRGCVNNANISSTSKRLGGIASFVGSGSVGTVFDSCTNNAALVSTDGTRGVGGILGCAEGGVKNSPTANDTIIRNCADFGSETAQNANGHAGAIVGSNWNESYTYTDDGGNTFKASTVDCGYVKNAVFGRAYAVASGDYLTTVKAADLAAGNTYTLLDNIAASETPVFTLSTGDTIAFDTALGYTFAGTIATANLYPVESSTSGTVTTYSLSSALFPRTATAGQDGTAEHPFEIADADDLQALATYTAGYSLNYIQTANIDMTSAGAFAGIGTYNVSPGSGTPFTGTYDGQGYKISNITLTDHDYAGVFNMVDGVNTVGYGIVKNLTVENVSYVGTGKKYCASIVGYALRGATLQNLTSAGTFGSESNPGTHNMAGIVVRVSGGTQGDGTQILNCTNNATIYGSYTKLAGICAISQEKGDGSNKMVFTGCANNGNLVLIRDYIEGDPVTGLAGIVGYSDVNTTMTDCSNTGTLTIRGTANTDRTGALIAQSYGHSIVDGGNNSAASTDKMIGHYGSGTVTGFQYATVDNGVATTVTTLAAGNTYLLEGNVAAGTVYTLASAGDTIAFNTALGYTFAGSVETAEGLLVTPTTAEGVTTFTAATVVATVGSDKFATLQAAIDAAAAGETKTVNLVGAATGAVNIPAGITVAVTAGSSLSDVSSLAGSGVLYAASPAALQIVNAKSGLFSASDWEGVVSLENLDISAAIDLTRFGNANSVVRFNNAGCAFTTGSTTAHAIKALEIGPNGLDLIGNYSAGTFTFPCALTGTGNLKIAAKNSQYGSDLKVAKFTGDVSGFTGSISFDADANCAVYFGEAAGNGNCISVAAGSAVTVAAGKTWTAPGGFVVNGSMTVNGTLDAGSEKLYGSGTITFNAATSLVVANTWTGTYNANFKAADNSIFYIPVHSNATTVINGVNGEFGGYPKFGSGAPNVAGPVTLNANWTIANGWTGTGYTTTFAKLSGSGNLTVDGTTSGTDPIYYTITELDGYTGTIGGARGNFTIGKVNVAEPPANGARVVKTNIGANGSINDDIPLYVNGADSGKTLTYDANGAEGAGLYYVAGGESIEPGEQSSTTYDSEEAAAAVTNTVTITVPTEVASNENISAADKAAYAEMFEAKVVPAAETGKYKVEVDLKPAVKEEIQTAVDKANTDTLAAVLDPEVADSVTVTTKPGLYYQIVTGNSLPLPAPAADKWVMAAGDSETISVTKPAGDAAFFKVYCSPTK